MKRVYYLLSLLVGLVLVFTGVGGGTAHAAGWYDSNWGYSRAITITTTTAATTLSYQVLVTLTTATMGNPYTHVKTDGSDIRFTNTDGTTLIDYWIETWSNTGDSKIWVEVPDVISASSSKTIYMYYGNAAASSTSSGANTFVFFDDFPGTTLDTGKWTLDTYVTASVSSSVVTISHSSGTYKGIYSINAYSIPYRFIVKAQKPNTPTANDSSAVGLEQWYDTDGDGTANIFSRQTSTNIQAYDTYKHGGSDNWTETSDTWTTSGWYRYEIKAKSGEVKYHRDDQLKLTVTDTNVIPTGPMYVMLSNQKSADQLKIDYCFIGKYVSPEPTVGVGSEVPQPPTISSFTPTSGGTGTSVTITGTNFTGATAVKFGGTTASSFTVDLATQITAVVAGGTTGTVSVTTPGGTATSAGTFTYYPPGVTVTPTSGLVTTEAGGIAQFTIVLTSPPTANVTIGLTSSDTSEGTVSPASVTFTTANWSTLQTVTVTGVNDDVVDGSIAYSIITAAATSTDPSYSGRIVSDVSVTNTDNDTAGIIVTPTSGLVTTEAGGIAQFTIRLNSQPVADVTIGLTSSDLTEGTVLPASVIFTALNWSTLQTVTVTGVNDFIVDGPIAYTIVTAAATSADPSYSGRDAADVSVTNSDNDTVGITVTPTAGLVTTEAGGIANFTIVLDTLPTADVTIGLTSSDLTEGTVSPASVTFTTANWSTPQLVTVTGVDDLVADGSIAYTIVTAAATSTDLSYSGFDASDVSVTNSDNDTVGITVSPTAGLVTTEAGGIANFTIVLNTLPTADVTIGLTSPDTTEGTVSPASVTFTTANWSTPQLVTVTGVDDFIVDGPIAYTIVTAPAVSTDSNYSGFDASDVSVTNSDNDTVGITVAPTAGLVTTEAGGIATFTIVLDTLPTADVTIGLTSSDLTEGTVSPASVTFTTANWSTPQLVTVTGVDDFVADGPIAYTIVTAAATSTDLSYSGFDASDVSVTNSDNDTVGITVSLISGNTTESGGTATFTIVLDTLPTADVSIGLTSSDLTEGTVSPASVTFTTANWSTPQLVTVTGVDDFVADGPVAYTIVTAAATSADPSYSGFDAADVSVTNTDNDTVGITVAPTAGLFTTEAGGTANFTIVLDTLPTADVSIGLTSSDTAEGTVLPASVTFTTVNWDTPQTVTVTGVDDLVADGPIAYTIVTAPAVSADSNYSGMTVSDVSVTNSDNDTPGITVTPTSGLFTTEAGGTANFTIVLNTLPTASVTIGLTSSNTAEGTVLPASVIFTTGNWGTPQTVTVTGVDDFIVDGPVAYTIVTAPAVSADSNYSGMTVSDVSVTNSDNDTPGITVTPTSGLFTTEAGGTANFTIVLDTLPTADVTIGLTSSDTAEGTVLPASVIFTTGNWSTPQTVTVTGVDDFIVDGPVAYTIVTAPAVSTDSNYSGFDASDVSVTNSDNETAGITVTPTLGLVTTEAGGTANFTIVLNTLPTADVTIGLSSSDTTEGTVLPASVTFTTGNWSTPQTVTVTGVDDFIVDGPVAYTIVTTAATSTDPGYSGMTVSDVSVTNSDNDTVLTVTIASLPNADVGAAYSQTLTASGGSGGTYIWSISGSLPAGLSLDGATGVISGTPTAVGTSSFTVEVGDGISTATNGLSITINPALIITITSLPNGSVGAPYSQTLTAGGGSSTYTWSISGSLPAGLLLNATTGVISGTPTAPGTSSFTVQVSDGIGTATMAASFFINPAGGGGGGGGGGGITPPPTTC